MNNEKFWFIDYMRINIRRHTPSELEKIVPFKELTKHCESCYPLKASNTAQKGFFESSINVVLPKKEFFRILHKYENDLFGYKISKIEISEDTCFNTSYDAEKAYVDFKKTGEFKWSTKSKIFEGDFPQIEENGKWYHETLYLGKKYSSDFSVYPRISKVNDKHCLHKEFILSGASNIKNKTGIEFIKDLVDFNGEKTFSVLEDRYTDHSEIDMLKLGKFLKKKTRKRKLSEEEKRKLKFHARFYCKVLQIKTYQDLKQRFAILKKSIREKKGKKSDCEKHILKRAYGYFKK